MSALIHWDKCYRLEQLSILEYRIGDFEDEFGDFHIKT